MSSKFINWLEGYLDASKNKVTPNQVKEIRKKIAEYRVQQERELIPLWDNSYDGIPLNSFNSLNKSAAHEEFLNEISKNKNASTMEELVLEEKK
jgi:hypothetical protein